jgi:hypothetical protein
MARPPKSDVLSRSERTLAGTAVHQSDRTSVQFTELSIRVFEVAEQFGWRVCNPTKEILGWGTAESEVRARIDAFHAGMTYIDRLKGRSAPNKTRLH